MDSSLLELASTLVAAVLTLFVLSYLVGDNILYRLAEHIFVGVSVGYALVVVFHTVLAPKLFSPLAVALGDGDWKQVLLQCMPLLLGLFLLIKPFKTTSWLGNLSVAFLLGVGAALAIQGALVGTLLPQIDATANVPHYTTRYGPGLGLFSGIVALVGTIGVLLYFYFRSGRHGRLAGLRESLVRTWGALGRWYILVAFGAILATTFMSRLSFLIARIQFLLDSVRGLLGG